MALGGLILLVVNETNTSGSNRTEAHHDFSERKIRLIFGAFALLSLLSNVTFFLLPKRKPENALEDNSDVERGFWDTLAFTFKAFASPKLWLLSFSWMYLGLSTAFYLGPYPTALIFTESLTEHTTLIPFYACSIGFGEIICGLIISYGSNKFRNFARLPTITIAIVTHLITFLLILLSTPRESSLRPTKQPALLIQPKQV
ncbi:unnamed protein product [Anisakis simplex]|uniref:UNC93-like protein MFSD11 (inferred by orthology to a human protein) n=1 Tax=Anisakis simplex TaxID=6269 RepID=A0A0M3JR79_ANISI|nr:unnamed protein product [Anisakis simplex]